MEAIRAFIAIELPEAIRQQLNQIELQIQTKAGEAGKRAVRWVPTSNMHLTLKFLGEVSTANIQALARMLQAEAGRYAAFDFTIGELGAFPNARRPRVIWVGADAPASLMGLQKAIEAETRLLGYPGEERPFSPHLTLGRITQSAHPEEVALVAHALDEMNVGRLGTTRVDKVHLFKSDLRPSGAVYTSLHSFLLGG
jgi:RNA 2',3'-cyclic 3'-phosphodiesterase